MAKRKAEIEMLTYGIYDSWDKDSKQIPKVKKFTTTVMVGPDVEFGYVLNIRKARGRKLTFSIKHPPFKDETGKVAPDFQGEQYVRNNNYHFFLGDTFWEPYSDKVGDWVLKTFLDGEEIASKTFHMTIEKVDD